MFRRLNLSRFPYPIRGVFDAIFCRNVMFYFDGALRERMVREFQGLLQPGGYLFVGRSETLIGIKSEFRLVGPAVYQLR
jgi:chemotaxis protein methyltransferase CheR